MKKTLLKPVKKGVNIPPFWKKKKLDPSFVQELEKSANSDPVLTDDYGEYRVGVFLHSCAIISVSYENGLWSLEIHSHHLVNLPLIEDVRYKYLPDDIVVTMLLLPRDQRIGNKVTALYQIPGQLRDGEMKDYDLPKEEVGNEAAPGE